jgi:hypothetical protein
MWSFNPYSRGWHFRGNSLDARRFDSSGLNLIFEGPLLGWAEGISQRGSAPPRVGSGSVKHSQGFCPWAGISFAFAGTEAWPCHRRPRFDGLIWPLPRTDCRRPQMARASVGSSAEPRRRMLRTGALAKVAADRCRHLLGASKKQLCNVIVWIVRLIIYSMVETGGSGHFKFHALCHMSCWFYSLIHSVCFTFSCWTLVSPPLSRQRRSSRRTNKSTSPGPPRPRPPPHRPPLR